VVPIERILFEIKVCEKLSLGKDIYVDTSFRHGDSFSIAKMTLM